MSTEQLVVSLETTSSFKDSGLLGHVHGMMIDIGLIHNSRRVESVSANLLLKDLLVQTVYKKKIKPLIGPFEFNVDAVIQWFETVDKQLLVPKATVSMSTGLITVSLGQEHFKCFNALKKQFLEKQTKKTDVKKTKAEFKRDEKPKHFYDHVAEHTRDDLRTGKFQYIMDPDETTVFASPGEIIFCNQDADGNSSMSWCYNEPRIISTVTFTPIPFNLPGDGSGDKNEAVMVPCQLQYFDFPTRQFVTYVEFELSENKGTDLSLPEVKEINVKDLLVSQIWRVLIRYDLNPEERDTEVTILPASLAASMRVDSCYIPNLVPVLQIYVSSPVIELRLSNHLQCLNKDVPSKLKPFVFQKSSSEDEEFALVTFKNPILIGSHLVGSYSRTSTQITTGMEASVVEYRNLTLQPAIDMFDLYSDISYSPLKKSSLLENNITVDPVTIRVGKGVVHTLNCAALAWNQVYNDKNKECCKVVMSHYVICNDTCHPVRFGQVGTDENLVLKPREMCCYSWRTHKNTQKLHLCLDGKIWKWCDGFSIDNDSHVVRAVRTIDQKYTLIIQVKPLSNVQKQVIIKGQLLVSNRLLQNLEMKISTLAATSPDAIEIDGLIQPEQTLPTYVLEPEEIKCIKIRMQGQTAWTQEILVSGDRMESSRQIKIMLHHNTFIHIWCKILTQKIQSALLTVVIFSPLYVIRSHLPKSLFVSVETPKIKQNYQVQIPGQGREFHLDCLGSNAAQSLAFHLSSEKEKSRPSLTLSTGMIDQVERANIKNMDIDSLTTQWKSSVLKEWPYCYNEGEFHPGEPLSTPEYSEFDLSLQTIDLHVNLSEYWPGCDTLLVDVFPWCLMTNRCDLDLVVILANGDTWTLPSKKTISPPTFDDGFNIGLLSDGNLYKTRDLKLSGEDVSTHKYMADIDTTLYMDGCLHTQIVTTTKSGKQIYFISLQSSFKHKIRIISVHETFCLTNLTNHTLKAALHCVSQKGKKVEPAYHCALNIPSHVKCKKDDSDIYPLTKWYLLEEMESANPQHSNKSDDYVQYLLLMDNTPANHKSCNSSSESTENVDSLVSDWSYPLRLLSNENKARMTLSLPRPGETPYPLCITSHIKNGVCYFVIEEDKSPICRLCNKTSIPVHYGYYDNIVAMSGVTVQEETELIDLLPTIKPGGIVFYTPGLINRKFHEGIFRKVPKLHIGIYPSDIGKIDSSQACLWSNAIDVNSNFESFVPIKNAVDVKVKVEKVAMVINVTIQPISKVDVSAKEIRSRISGKDTKVISESEQESFKVCLEMEKEETENAKITFDETRLLYSIGLHIHHICVILQDESDSQTISEVLRVSVDNLFLAHHPSSQGFTENSLSEKYHICTSVCAASIQIDNQLFYAKGLFDFPVIFIKQSNAAKTMFAVPEFHSLSVIEKLAVMKSTSFAHMQIIMEEDILGNPVIGTLELAIEPSVVNIDDNFVFRILKEIEGLIPTNLSDSKHSRIDIKKLPKSFRKMSGVLSCPIRIKHLCIQPISVLLSVHASMKLFIASDRTPLSFGSFDKEGVTSTTHQLIQVLVMHYASGALFRAGIVVGSLEILGNPTGLVRSIGTGVADLVKLPYAGLTRGPGAFVKGVSGGMSSCIKNISSGMITSVTNFASSVSRNMDRLSMDSTHLQRQEVQRRQMPDGISSGLKQGLTSFGISLLGAVAGLADQPIQNILSQEGDSDNQLSKSKTASGIVTGVGKGLVGVFTKPIGGAAELVSQTGQGLLHGTGLASNRQNPIYKPEKILISESSNGRIKYIKKFLHSVPNSDIQMMVKADFIDLTESDVKVDLLLTNELLFVINCEDDAQQQAFSLAELEMSSNDREIRQYLKKNICLTGEIRQYLTKYFSTGCNENKDRVAEFIDGTLVYVSQVTPSPSTTCDSQSESSLSPVGRPSAGPQFHFLLDKSYKESFISLFYMIKDTLSGKDYFSFSSKQA
ncbi:hypothetical protein KUTeg_000794 [Tegillarca granosa]|uniref:Uncharacterized protein n=1 Tax=Tegillarca granosa TaxID=220873 RepID=A0ABQ9FYK7_TEGGR|nr:hypothetical protein KUTeg_000794 [Tegillarca granosa]